MSFLGHLFNLKAIGLGNGNEKRISQGIYNHFIGSLKSLQNMNNLEILDISNTDLDSGLEYLPDSVETFFCSADIKKDAEVQHIYNLFSNERGEVETDRGGNIKSFPRKL